MGGSLALSLVGSASGWSPRPWQTQPETFVKATKGSGAREATSPHGQARGLSRGATFLVTGTPREKCTSKSEASPSVPKAMSFFLEHYRRAEVEVAVPSPHLS